MYIYVYNYTIKDFVNAYEHLHLVNKIGDLVRDEDKQKKKVCAGIPIKR